MTTKKQARTKKSGAKAGAIDHATLDAIGERLRAGESILLHEFRAYRDGGGAASYHVLRRALIERIGMSAFAELVPQRGGRAKSKATAAKKSTGRKAAAKKKTKRPAATKSTGKKAAAKGSKKATTQPKAGER
jgi:hypothetical protein